MHSGFNVVVVALCLGAGMAGASPASVGPHDGHARSDGGLARTRAPGAMARSTRAMFACSSGSFLVSPCVASDSTASYATNHLSPFSFNFANNSSSNRAAIFSCSVSGQVTACSVSPRTATVIAHDNLDVTVTYSTARGPVGGTVVVSGLGVTATLTVGVWAPPLYVTPPANVRASRVSRSVALDTFTVQNNTATTATVGLTAVCGAPVSCSISGTSTRTLASGASTPVYVSSTAGGIGTSGTLTLRATNGALAAPANLDSASVPVNVPYAPSVSGAAQNGEHRSAALCAVGCFDVHAAYSTPSYTSLDVERSLTLWYSSAQAAPIATVLMDMSDGSQPAPQKLSLQLNGPVGSTAHSVAFTNGSAELFFQYPTYSPNALAPLLRLAGQFDATSMATGAYSYTATLSSYWTSGLDSNTIKSSTAAAGVLVVNERTSPYGAGWTVAGVQHVYSGTDSLSAVITDGAGDVAKFTRSSAAATSFVSSAADFSTLTQRNWTTDTLGYDRRYPDGTTYTFTKDGRLVLVKDRFANTTTFSYAGLLLTAVTDPAGKSLTLTYDGRGKLSTVTDPAGRVSRFTVDSVTNDLTRIVDPTGVDAFRGVYDHNRLVEAFDRAGASWRYAYDYAGKVKADSTPTILAGGSPQRLVTRYRSSESTALIDTAAYAAGARVGSFASPAPPVYFDSVRAAVTPPSGDSVRLAVDRFGAPTSVEQPALKSVTRISSNANAQVTDVSTWVKGRQVASSWFQWQGPNLLHEQDNFAGTSTDYTYDATYVLLTSASGSSGSSQYYLDAATHSRVDSAQIGAGALVSRYSYDTRGRLTRTVDPRGDTTTASYETSGYQNTLSVSAGSRTTSFRRDGYGRVEKGTNARGDSVLTRYDSLNRVRQTVEPYATTTTYGYGPLTLDTVTDPIGQQYRFARNQVGWLDSLMSANTGDPAINRQDRHVYTRLGGDSVWTNRRGWQTRTAFDQQGRPRTRTLVDSMAVGGTAVMSFSYDTLGTFAVDSSAAAIDTLRTDSTGLVSTETTVRHGRRYVVTATTAKSGVLRSIVLRLDSASAAPAHSVTFGYDEMLQLDTIKVNGGASTVLTQDADGQVTQIVLPGGTTITRSYTPLHQPLAMHVLGYLDNTFGGYFAQDSLDNLAQWSTAGGDSSIKFAYDSLGRLATVRHYYMPGMTCTPDPHAMDGERCTTSSTPVLASTTTYAYDKVGNPAGVGDTLYPGNRLKTHGGFTMTYDADGNMLTKSGNGLSQSFTWNSANQLTSATTNGSAVRFWYDGQGRRVRKSTAAKTLDYIYAGGQLLAEVDSATGAIERAYSYYPGVDAPHSVTQGGSTYYYVRDAAGVGSVAGLIDGAGNMKNRYRYDPFGASQSKTESVSNPLQFAGREYDSETGLYYNRARYYDPQLKRFISEDPIGLDGGINQYAYAANDPVNASDPSGLECHWTKEAYVNGALAPNGAAKFVCTHDLPPIEIKAGGPHESIPRDDGCGYSCAKAPPPAQPTAQQVEAMRACAAENKDNIAITVATITAGLPIPGTKSFRAGSTYGTSIFSTIGRAIFPKRFSTPLARPAPTLRYPGSDTTKPGTYFGRWLAIGSAVVLPIADYVAIGMCADEYQRLHAK